METRYGYRRDHFTYKIELVKYGFIGNFEASDYHRWLRQEILMRNMLVKISFHEIGWWICGTLNLDERPVQQSFQIRKQGMSTIRVHAWLAIA